jgi:hypothetical protein
VQLKANLTILPKPINKLDLTRFTSLAQIHKNTEVIMTVGVVLKIDWYYTLVQLLFMIFEFFFLKVRKNIVVKKFQNFGVSKHILPCNGDLIFLQFKDVLSNNFHNM